MQLIIFYIKIYIHIYILNVVICQVVPLKEWAKSKGKKLFKKREDAKEKEKKWE